MVRLASSRPETTATPAASFTPIKRNFDEDLLRELRSNLAYSLLQTNLDLEATLKQFFENLKDFVQTSGMTYLHKNNDIELSFGRNCVHKAAYTLATDDLDLGEIAFTRGKRFGETELAMIEMLIGVLFFPLRNALMYRDAIESSLKDKLTNIGNRHAMDEAFEREIKLAKRHEQPVSVLLIDIDHFKRVNDNAGHIEGDKTLRQVASTIQQTLRETDQVFRFGGEEFVAILHNTSAHEAKVIAERIRVNIAMSPVSLNNSDLLVTVSIGVSTHNGTDTPEELLEKADTALYKAKNDGRNRVAQWS